MKEQAPPSERHKQIQQVWKRQFDCNMLISKLNHFLKSPSVGIKSIKRKSNKSSHSLLWIVGCTRSSGLFVSSIHPPR